MSTFKIGDRVVLARPDELDRLNGLKEGMIGTIRRVGHHPLLAGLGMDPENHIPLVLVSFDGYTQGTRGGGDNVDGTPSHRNIEVSQLELAGEQVPAEAGPEPVPAEAGPGSGRIPFPPASLIGRRIRVKHSHAMLPSQSTGVLVAPVATPYADVTPGADTDEDGDYWVILDAPLVPSAPDFQPPLCVGTRDQFELID